MKNFFLSLSWPTSLSLYILFSDQLKRGVVDWLWWAPGVQLSDPIAEKQNPVGWDEVCGSVWWEESGGIDKRVKSSWWWIKHQDCHLLGVKVTPWEYLFLSNKVFWLNYFFWLHLFIKWIFWITFIVSWDLSDQCLLLFPILNIKYTRCMQKSTLQQQNQQKPSWNFWSQINLGIWKQIIKNLGFFQQKEYP